MQDFIITQLSISILVDQVEEPGDLLVNIARAKRMHEFDEAIKSDSLRLLIHFLSNVVEELLDDHCIFKLQLREAIIHQRAQIDARTLDLHIRKVLQVPRRLLLFLLFALARGLLFGGVRGLGRRSLLRDLKVLARCML